MQVHGLTRRAVALASAIAPRSVGRAVFWRSCRTTSAPVGGPVAEKAEQRLAAAASQRVAFNGGHLQTYVFDPEPSSDRGECQGTIALVHGWTGRAAFMAAFAGPLNEAGFRVVAIDLPGHGASDGRLLHVPLGVAALHAVHQATGPWYGIVGHSFGGLVAMSLASGRVIGVEPVRVERLVLMASPDSARFIFELLGAAIGLGQRAQTAMNDMVVEVAGRPIEDYDGADMLRAAGARTLVLHAPDDREVPYACAQRLAAGATHHPPLVTLTPVPGVGHRRILYAPAAIELVSAFMSAPGRIDHGQIDPISAAAVAIHAAPTGPMA